MRAGRYYFTVRGSNRDYPDDEGTPLPDARSAFALANRIIAELKDDGDYGGHVMIVRDGRRPRRVYHSVLTTYCHGRPRFERPPGLARFMQATSSELGAHAYRWTFFWSGSRYWAR